MLQLSDLENLLHKKGRSNYDRTLLCLALDPIEARSNSEICKIGKRAGWSGVAASTVATCLGRAKGLAINTPEGWKLTEDGEAHVRTLVASRQTAKPVAAAEALRKHLPNIKDVDSLAFVEEAVECFEHGLRRSAVVMSWVGAMSVLYRHVLSFKLAEFNNEANHRNPKWKAAVTVDGLALMKEYDFLQVLQAISVIGKSVKAQLEHCLDTRNGCGHPNSFKIADSKVAAHVEVLMLNVFEKF